jgi:hypothetical protein
MLRAGDSLIQRSEGHAGVPLSTETRARCWLVESDAWRLVLGCRLDLRFLVDNFVSPCTVPTLQPYVESPKEIIGEFLAEFHRLDFFRTSQSCC